MTRKVAVERHAVVYPAREDVEYVIHGAFLRKRVHLFDYDRGFQDTISQPEDVTVGLDFEESDGKKEPQVTGVNILWGEESKKSDWEVLRKILDEESPLVGFIRTIERSIAETEEQRGFRINIPGGLTGADPMNIVVLRSEHSRARYYSAPEICQYGFFPEEEQLRPVLFPKEFKHSPLEQALSMEKFGEIVTDLTKLL
jgi:hypothetical protein